jgi:hypothetical protein
LALKNQSDLSPFHVLPRHLIESLLETIQILGLSIDTPNTSSLEEFIIKASPQTLSLDLISNGIEVPGLSALAELIRQNKTLLELKATYHRFKDPGSVLLFAALAENKSLQVCDPSDNVLNSSKIPCMLNCSLIIM